MSLSRLRSSTSRALVGWGGGGAHGGGRAAAAAAAATARLPLPTTTTAHLAPGASACQFGTAKGNDDAGVGISDIKEVEELLQRVDGEVPGPEAAITSDPKDQEPLLEPALEGEGPLKPGRPDVTSIDLGSPTGTTASGTAATKPGGGGGGGANAGGGTGGGSKGAKEQGEDVGGERGGVGGGGEGDMDIDQQAAGSEAGRLDPNASPNEAADQIVGGVTKGGPSS